MNQFLKGTQSTHQSCRGPVGQACPWSFWANSEDHEDADDVPPGPAQRALGSPIGDYIRRTTEGSANLLGTFTGDGVDYEAIHPNRRRNKDPIKRRRGIHEVVSLFVQ